MNAPAVTCIEQFESVSFQLLHTTLACPPPAHVCKTIWQPVSPSAPFPDIVAPHPYGRAAPLHNQLCRLIRPHASSTYHTTVMNDPHHHHACRSMRFHSSGPPKCAPVPHPYGRAAPLHNQVCRLYRPHASSPCQATVVNEPHHPHACHSPRFHSSAVCTPVPHPYTFTSVANTGLSLSHQMVACRSSEGPAVHQKRARASPACTLMTVAPHPCRKSRGILCLPTCVTCVWLPSAL